MMSADLQRLDELPDRGAVTWKIRRCHAQGRRTGRAPTAQSIDERWNVPAASSVQIHGNAVVNDRGEITARDAHRVEDEAAERTERRRIAALNR
jgi:hypothetical protein